MAGPRSRALARTRTYADRPHRMRGRAASPCSFAQSGRIDWRACNVERVDECAQTRLRVVLRDDTLIDASKLHQGGVEALIRLPNKTLHLLVGLNADQYAAEMKGQLALSLAA